MTRKRHTEEHIIAVLKDTQAEVSVQDLCRKHVISDATFYKWRTKYAGLNGKFREKCLNEHWFLTLQEAQVVIEAWRREYNEERTHRNQLRWPWCNKRGKVSAAARGRVENSRI